MPPKSKFIRETAIPLFTKIPAFPNAFPYNELLLDGKLICKTRNWVWRHRGLTLLYTSTRTDDVVADAHGMNVKAHAKKVLVGVGNLVDVRPLTKDEMLTLVCQFNNLDDRKKARRKIYLERQSDLGNWWCSQKDWWKTPRMVLPLPIGLFFKDLKRFQIPVPFNWPTGPVKPIGVDVRVVAETLKNVGILPADVPGLMRKAA